MWHVARSIILKELFTSEDKGSDCLARAVELIHYCFGIKEEAGGRLLKRETKGTWTSVYQWEQWIVHRKIGRLSETRAKGVAKTLCYYQSHCQALQLGPVEEKSRNSRKKGKTNKQSFLPFPVVLLMLIGLHSVYFVQNSFDVGRMTMKKS